MSTSRDKILGKLKEAQKKRGGNKMASPDFSTPIYPSLNKKPADSFQENLELVAGKVIRVKNLERAVQELKKICQLENLKDLVCLEPELQKVLKNQVEFKTSMDDLQHIGTGITTCEFLVAHLGSVLISSASPSGRRLNVFPETHIVVAHHGQVAVYLDEALELLEKKYPNGLPSSITNITGPSRTADIEKTLVMGMHGPKNLYVLLADEPF
jgi:L-lactate dehydrogenase complex protein LldG